MTNFYQQRSPLEIACKHHCTHRSAPRHVSVPRSRNFSDYFIGQPDVRVYVWAIVDVQDVVSESREGDSWQEP